MQNNPYEAPVAEGGGVPGSLSTGRHEFSDEENKQIGETGRRAWLWGVVAIVSGIFGLGGLVVAFAFRSALAQSGLDPNWVTIFIVGLLPLVAANLVVGALYMGAGNALKAVVKTQGADVEHMMRGVGKLASAFFVEFAVGTVALVGGFAAGVALAVYTPDVVEESGDVEGGDFDD
jgi:O-antigen/teichoic acid export membrane protein